MQKVTRTCKVAVGMINGKRTVEPTMSVKQMSDVYVRCGADVKDVHEEELTYECTLEEFFTLAKPKVTVKKEKKDQATK